MGDAWGRGVNVDGAAIFAHGHNAIRGACGRSAGCHQDENQVLTHECVFGAGSRRNTDTFPKPDGDFA